MTYSRRQIKGMLFLCNRGKLQMERVSARMTFRFITYGTKENIIALKETFVFRKQHGSCEHILNVVAALLKHLPLLFLFQMV